jgi:hypothetical protein
VSDDVTHGDRSATKALPEFGRILRHGLVEVQLALLDQLHQQRGRERFRERGDPIVGLGHGRNLVLDVRKPDALRPQELLVLDDGRRDARNLERLPQVVELLLEPLDPLVYRRHPPALVRRHPRATDDRPQPRQGKRSRDLASSQT